MKSMTRKARRLVKGIALALAAAAVSIPAAQAAGQVGTAAAPDAVDRYLGNVAGQIDAYLQSVPASEQDAVDRYLRNVAGQLDRYLGASRPDVQPQPVETAAPAAQEEQASAVEAPAAMAPTHSGRGGIDWADAGIGAGLALAATALAAGALAARHRGRPVHP
jgi:hypothetical protein